MELWVGPIELEPELGTMHLSKTQTEGVLGLELNILLERWKKSEHIRIDWQEEGEVLVLPGAMMALRRIRKQGFHLRGVKTALRGSAVPALLHTNRQVRIGGKIGKPQAC